MRFFHQIVFFCLFTLFACKKEQTTNNEDRFIDQPEQLSVLNAEVSAAGYQFLEVQWTSVNNTHFKSVAYTIYLDDQKIMDGVTATKYSLINLKAGKEYKIKIVAATKEGMQVEQILNATTLGGSPGNQEIIYKEYSIHNYSRLMGPTSIQKLDDGGHLIARLLQHPDYFDHETVKTIIFRTDKSGNMLWYRLLSPASTSSAIYENIWICSHNAGLQGILFMPGYAAKFDITDGEILHEKKYQDLNQMPLHSVFYASPQQIILGTSQGDLIAINPEDLNVIWRKNSPDRMGSIISIKVDSKKHIYYIFRDLKDQHSQVRVHKCNPNGDFMKEFLFDGSLPNEYNWGFWMSALLIDEQDNLYLFGHNSDYNFLRYFKFNTAGELIKKNVTSDYLNANNAFFNTKGEIIVTGQVDGGGLNTYTGLYVFDKDMNIKSKRYFTEIEPHILTGITGNSDGSYNIFLHYMQTYNYENPNFIFIKTDADGKF